MDGFPVLTEIVDCFTSLEQLLSFVSAYGLEDDPYVRQRIDQLRMHTYKCSLCGESFNTITKFQLHQLHHQAITDFDMSLLDDSHDIRPVSTRNDTTVVNSPSDNTDTATPYKKPCFSAEIKSSTSQQGAGIPVHTFRKKGVKIYAKNAATDVSFEVKLTDQLQDKKLSEITQDLHNIFDDVLDQVRNETQENTLGRVIIEHRGLTDPIVVSLRPFESIDSSTLLDEITKVLQSNEELTVDSSLLLTIGTITLPSGGGRLHITRLTGNNNSLDRKRSVISRSSKTMCMPMAITICFLKTCRMVTATEWKVLTKDDGRPMSDKILQHKTTPKWYYYHITDTERSECTSFARRLCELTDVSTEKPCNIQEISRFENLLDLQILVISAKLGNKFIRVGENKTTRKKIFLYLTEVEGYNHFAAIVNIAGFFSSFFCQECLKPYSKKDAHSCSTTCDVCRTDGCMNKPDMMSCRSCFMPCRSLECFQRHLVEKKTKQGVRFNECEKRYRCKTCKKTFDRLKRPPELHQCGEWVCPCCREICVGNHLCYQRAINTEETDPLMIFFDCEATQHSLLQCDEGFQEIATRCQKCKDNDEACTKCKGCQNCFKSWCGTREHKVNFVCMQTACKNCKNEQVNERSRCVFCGVRCSLCSSKEKNKFKKAPCPNTCGFRQRLFRGQNAKEAFCSTIFNEQYKNGIVMSHNGSGYDNYFLVDWLTANSIRPEIIFCGSKIMYMLVPRGLNIRVLDSAKFLSMPLSKLPKSFGLTELKKGYFPHFFNTAENQNYVGPYPDITYYGCDSMNEEDRTSFLTWYETKTNDIFDFAKEMKEYCCSDTTILREGMLRFRELMLDATSTEYEKMDPTTKQLIKTFSPGIDCMDYVTIASVCMAVYRARFLEETFEIEVLDGETEVTGRKPIRFTDKGYDVLDGDHWKTSDQFLIDHPQKKFGQRKFVKSPLAHVPSEGYTKRYNYSRCSIVWLEWLMRRENISIRHALNEGEYRIPGTKFHVDGYCKETNEVFEFLGCHWHGCKICFPNDRSEVKTSLTRQSMNELYAITQKRKAQILQLGYKYRQIWEHQFHSQLNSNFCLKEFASKLDVEERLNPRDAFYGGRTDATKLYYKTKDAEKIKYVDFTSLYPWTNKYCRYPMYHPEIITDSFESLDKYFGLCKLTIVGPRNLYHGVLPYRCDGKLTFPLCRTCAITKCQARCRHSDSERSITGTYATPEIMLALEKGYRVIKIHEIWHFPETTQYDKNTASGGLFASYVNTFLKLKQEASGWPNDCKSEEDRQEYIRNYKEVEGIELDYDNIKENKGLRSLAKLCLNSLWGKFGQRLILKKTVYFHESEADKFFQFLSDPTKVVENFHVVSDDTIQLEWTANSRFPPIDVKTNIFIAIFTAMWGRLKLYEVLDMLGERVLYMDTDSCIYVSKEGEKEPALGNYLGELTSEIPPDEGHIVEFVSGGPKNYAYRTLKSERCKVKGFTLNFMNSKIVNFSALQEMVTKKRDQHKTLTNRNKICRLPLKRKLYSKEESKKYAFTYDKRVILDNFDTVPYGY